MARLLIISDVHSNLAALSRLPETADMTVFLGDAVDYGPLPSESLEILRQRAGIAVKGNHDAAVAEGYRCGFYRGVPEEIRDLNRRLLSAKQIAYLAALPTSASFEFGGARFAALHASASDPLSGYLLPFLDDSFWRAQAALVDADFWLLGHTHWPMIRKLDRLTAINPGSIGQPRDGIPLPSYALWEDGEATVRRYEYPIEETVRALEQAGLRAETVALLSAILRNGG